MRNRRQFLAVCSAAGLSGTLFPGALYALAQGRGRGANGPVTRDLIEAAAKIADVTIADDYKDAMLNSLNNAVRGYEAIYALHMDNSVQPAFVFDPLPMGWKLSTVKTPMRISTAAAAVPRAPKNLEDVAFYNVRQLAELIRSRKVSSLALTQMYIDRLKRYGLGPDSKLKCAITITEDRALGQAKEAD